ncbi:MAG TPA: hypothetical protein VEV38_00080 [Candidatus Eremiobacteraceae bacterium]|nr:hypothetical protein [Candidatus Eremiobacteraceae bacterium]
MIHVQTWQNLATGDGNHLSGWEEATPWLNFVDTNAQDSLGMHQAGLTVAFYTVPNREGPGDPMYTNDESTFAHDCNGNRIASLGVGQGRYLMDPHSTDLGGLWETYVQNMISNGAWIDYVFEDKADTINKTSANPCNFNQSDWSNASNQLDSYMTSHIVYNSLSNTSSNGGQPQVAPSIALNQTSVGGMSEDCYVRADNTLRTRVSWEATELTEIDMALAQKMFVCNGGMSTDGTIAIQQRIYQYASYLLTYDPQRTIYETQYADYSGLFVYPEVQLVAKQPLISEPNNITGLLQSGGTYARQYKACYLAGNYVGPCAAVVNANSASMPSQPSRTRRGNTSTRSW